jgi:putative transposase
MSPKALFRYQVVAELRARIGSGKTLATAVQEVVQLQHADHLGRSRVLFPRTVYRWLQAFTKHGLPGLEDPARARIKDSSVLSRDLLEFLRREKANDHRASVPELVRRAREAHIIVPTDKIARSSVWRACRRMDLPLTRVRKLADTDMRRYAYPNRMLMVLADGKHFRAGVERLRRVALIFLDDATRYALEAWVGTSEDTELFLHALHDTIRGYGLMVSLFLDNGGSFTGDDTLAIVAALDINLIHGTAGYPEGHGKVERFNQTLLARLLRGMDGNPDVDPEPAALRLRLRHFLQAYNKTPHEGLDMRTPEECFLSDPRPLEFPHDQAWLTSRFVLTEKRSVSKDNVISKSGVAYEVPRGHAGTSISVFRHLLEQDALSVLHQGNQVRLYPVDLVKNAYARRARPTRPAPQEKPSPTTAAERAFQTDHKPLVSADGGYPKGNHDDDDDTD